MKHKMSVSMLTLALITMALAGCGGQVGFSGSTMTSTPIGGITLTPIPPGSMTATATPTEIVAPTAIPAGDVAPTSTASVSATEPLPSSLIVTLDDNGKIITLQVGQSFLLKLGDDLNWTVTIEDQSIISRAMGVMVIRGAQGLYDAHKPGRTTLTAVGDLPCRQAQPPCMAPSRMFQIQVVVQ